jgi:hypothetical protein
MEPKGSLPCSQLLTIGPCPEQVLNNCITTIQSVIIFPLLITGSSNVVTGETKSFFSVARSVSRHK